MLFPDMNPVPPPNLRRAKRIGSDLVKAATSKLNQRQLPHRSVANKILPEGLAIANNSILVEWVLSKWCKT
jgi:hypothetical protein